MISTPFQGEDDNGIVLNKNKIKATGTFLEVS
jgi:hypothetical protein